MSAESHPVSSTSAAAGAALPDRVRALGPKLVLDLHSAEGAGLTRKQLDHTLPRAATLASRSGEDGARMIAPVLRVRR